MSGRGREGLSWSRMVFLHLSLLPLSHTQTWIFQHCPLIEGQTLALVYYLTAHNTKIPKHLNIYALSHLFKSVQSQGQDFELMFCYMFFQVLLLKTYFCFSSVICVCFSACTISTLHRALTDFLCVALLEERL